MIYLDAAATSFPKSPAVTHAMREYLEKGSSPGRAGHRLATWAEEKVWATREALGRLVGCSAPERVTFSLNATMSLNAVISHLRGVGGTVLTSSFEHNSVCRPLHHASAQGPEFSHTVIPPTLRSPFDLDRLEHELSRAHVAGVVMTWASNVSGAILPVAEASALCRRWGALFCVDATQALGHVEVDADLADVLVFAGHKGLGGPQGVGGAILGAGVEIAPFVRGGSGGRSESLDQPRWLPWSQEAGTLNGVGIAGLGAAVKELGSGEVKRRQLHSNMLRNRLVAGLTDLDLVELVELQGDGLAVGVLSFNIQGMRPTLVASLLEEHFDILVRAGLHCAPLAHATQGTAPHGTVRASFGPDTTPEDIDVVVAAVEEIATTHRE